MQCQYRTYVELVGILQKKKKGNLFTRVKCHSTPLDTCMLTICSSLDIKGNFSSINEKKYTEYTDGFSFWFKDRKIKFSTAREILSSQHIWTANNIQ